MGIAVRTGTNQKNTESQSESSTAEYNDMTYNIRRKTKEPSLSGQNTIETISENLDEAGHYDGDDEATELSRQSEAGTWVERPLPTPPLLPSSDNPAPPLAPIIIPSYDVPSSPGNKGRTSEKRRRSRTSTCEATTKSKSMLLEEKPPTRRKRKTHEGEYFKPLKSSKSADKLLDLASVALSEPSYSGYSSESSTLYRYCPMPPPPGLPPPSLELQ